MPGLVGKELQTAKMASKHLDADVKALLDEHAFLQLVETDEGEQKRLRVRCDLTSHELLPTKAAIESYLQTKKFKKAKEWYCYDYSQYEPYIVSHRRKPKSLYCNVTNTILNRIPSEVEKHVNGKRFQRLKEHVKFETRKSKDEEAKDGDDDEFDANAFEFENQQAIYSDEEEKEEAPRRKRGQDEVEEDEDEDEEEEEEEEEEEDDGEDDEEEDDMAEFYPQEDDDEPEDDHIREAVARITKKRKEPTDNEEKEASSKKSKKQRTKPQKKNK